MKKIITWFLFWRSMPSILVYVSLDTETKDKLAKDLLRDGIKLSIISLHERLLWDPIFRKIFFIRVLDESVLKYRLCRWSYKPLYGLEISTTGEKIGGGLKIFHGYSTIIFCHSIGENLTVYQNVTLGRGKKINGNPVPIIGNNVTVYAGANVIGGITIGDNAVIGAGTTVTKDVPPNTVVVSAPNRYL